jgi:hypothetical protein
METPPTGISSNLTSSSESSTIEEVSAICAGPYGDGSDAFLMFVRSNLNLEECTTETRTNFFHYEAYSIIAPNRRLDGSFNNFKVGLPYTFRYRRSNDQPPGSIKPIVSKLHEISLRTQKDKQGTSPVVRGSFQPAKGKYLPFLLRDVPDVGYYGDLTIQLYKDQVPECYHKCPLGGDFMLEVRTGSSLSNVFPCVGKLTYTINRNDFSNIVIRDIPPPRFR